MDQLIFVHLDRFGQPEADVLLVVGGGWEVTYGSILFAHEAKTFAVLAEPWVPLKAQHKASDPARPQGVMLGARPPSYYAKNAAAACRFVGAKRTIWVWGLAKGEELPVYDDSEKITITTTKSFGRRKYTQKEAEKLLRTALPIAQRLWPVGYNTLVAPRIDFNQNTQFSVWEQLAAVAWVLWGGGGIGARYWNRILALLAEGRGELEDRGDLINFTTRALRMRFADRNVTALHQSWLEESWLQRSPWDLVLRP